LFTGIIEEIGQVASLRGAELCIAAGTVLEGLSEGDSIAVNGACLTAVAFDDAMFRVQVSPETFEKTTLGGLNEGDPVNLERAMAANQRFGGHFVQGHVDGVGEVVGFDDQGDFQLWHFRAPALVARYLIPKGSVAIDGISLTVVNPVGDTFSVAIIPATLEKTVLPQRMPGDKVNMEADMIGKHIYHFMHHAKGESISMDFLREHGFAQEK
jgi:riboflavin synthase